MCDTGLHYTAVLDEVRRKHAYARVYVYTRMGISNYVSQLVTNASSATCLILSAYSRFRVQQRLQARYMIWYRYGAVQCIPMGEGKPVRRRRRSHVS